MSVRSSCFYLAHIKLSGVRHEIVCNTSFSRGISKLVAILEMRADGEITRIALCVCRPESY
jgi:hypothetical protein